MFSKRIICPEGLSKGLLYSLLMFGSICKMIVTYDTENPVFIAVEIIKTKMIGKNGKNQYPAADPKGEASYIYYSIYFMAFQIPNCNQEMIFKHRTILLLKLA